MTHSPLIFNILIAFGAFQALFLSVILLSQPHNKLPKKLFSLFLIIEGFTLMERLLAETELMTSVPHLLGVSYPISFIKPPILFFMALAIVNPKHKFGKAHLLHFIPFMIMLLLNVPFYFQTAAYKLEMVAAFINYVPTYDSFNFWLFFLFYLYIGIYIFIATRVMTNYKAHVKNHKLANWYLNVLYLYSGSLLIGFLYFAISPSELIDIPLINTISMLIMTFLIQSIAYSFLSQSNVFGQNAARLFNDQDKLLRDENLIKSKLEVQKVYLDEGLNLNDFARSLDLPKKYVSDIINQRFGKSFKELIGQYRVSEAKTIMAQEIGSNTQLIVIGQESGFSNKVSFYRTFKKHTGKSPSQYFESLRRNHSAN